MMQLISHPLDATDTAFENDCRTISCLFDQREMEALIKANGSIGEFGIEVPQVLNSAVAKRQAEFVAGRYCARLALQKLGYTAYKNPIEIGKFKQPLWPEGIIGSITHSKGFAASTVANGSGLKGVGIDSENMIQKSTAKRVAAHILTAGELARASRHYFTSDEQYLTVLFSAKESIYKCLFPIIKSFFGFHVADITIDPECPGKFGFELTQDLNSDFQAGFSHFGFFVIDGNVVHTRVIL